MKSGKTILITGANSGIGRVLAESYAQSGVNLLLLARNQQRLETVAKKCAAKGAEVTLGCFDIRDAEALKAWLLEQDEKHPIDLLIANAGISVNQAAEIANSEAEAHQLVFDINLQGTLNTLLPLLPRMLARKSGQIAIMSSLAAYNTIPRAAPYCAAKAALLSYGLALRVKHATDGLKVSVICPGFIATPMTAVNKFKMPFLMNGEKAGQLIMIGLRKNKAVIAFPWQLRAMSWFSLALPTWMTEKIVKRFSA